MMNSEKEINALRNQYSEKFEELAEIKEKCLQEGLPYEEMVKKTLDLRKELTLIDRNIRLLKEPVVTMGKKWAGHFMLFGDFISLSLSGEMTDKDGYGFYATQTSVSNIRVYPSDIVNGIYRDDFTCVLWIDSSSIITTGRTTENM